MIDKIIETTSYKEDDKTLNLFKFVKQDEVLLNKSTLLKILKWKSPRPLRFYNENEEEYIKNITQLAFQQEDDKVKIHILTALKGVNYPSASAILMFKNPEYFPVLDIRVWKQLYKNKLVSVNPRGIGFTLDQWALYINIIRSIANKHNISARVVEKKLFDYDKQTQEGNLY
jgi:thermostable 8-oxoguanine DNA glycosylase